MKKIEKILKQIKSDKVNHLELKTINGQHWVIFPNNRKQRIFIVRIKEYYSIRSVVLTKSKVNEYYKDWMYQFIWQQNKETPLVSFLIDKKGRLAGRITHLAEYLDKSELFFYIEILAKECDRLEYILSGKDIN